MITLNKVQHVSKYILPKHKNNPWLVPNDFCITNNIECSEYKAHQKDLSGVYISSYIITVIEKNVSISDLGNSFICSLFPRTVSRVLYT